MTRKFRVVLAVAVTLGLPVASTLLADDPNPAEHAPQTRAWPAPPRPPHFRDTIYGARPQPGYPMTAAEGHPHYMCPPRHYGLWYRPAAFAEDNGDACRSRPFNPRGYGVPHRRTDVRMDYHRYVVKELPSVHGPSYYKVRELQPCPACGQSHCNCRP